MFLKYSHSFLGTLAPSVKVLKPHGISPAIWLAESQGQLQDFDLLISLGDDLLQIQDPFHIDGNPSVKIILSELPEVQQSPDVHVDMTKDLPSISHTPAPLSLQAFVLSGND